jgi:hypothetical protein
MGLFPFSDEKVGRYSVGCITDALLTKYYLGDPVWKEKMERACDMYGRRERHTGFWWGNLKKRGHLGNVGIKVNDIIKMVLK